MNNREQLIELMQSRSYNGFAEQAVSKIIALDAVEDLYLLATDNRICLSAQKKQNIIFRSAYCLEYIYFKHPHYFLPFKERFIEDYSLCENPSAKRHFTKMMSDIIKHSTLNEDQINNIAETTAAWLVEPGVKVAVKAWGMSILTLLRPHVDWLSEIWGDIEAVILNNITPGIEVRLKRGWK